MIRQGATGWRRCRVEILGPTGRRAGPTRPRGIRCVRALTAIGAISLALIASGSANAAAGEKAGSTLTASAPGVTAKTITIGLVAPITGDASSSAIDTAAAAQARIDLQNAEGGVDGRKLRLIVQDDTSTPAGDETAVKTLIHKGVFGIVSNSAFFFGGYRAATQTDVPVTGDGYDGPEWGLEPNMFDVAAPTSTTYKGKIYGYTDIANFLKKIGASKVAVFTNTTPSAVADAKEQVAADTKDGLANCYEDLTLPLGTVSFTAQALEVQHLGCQTVVGIFVESSNVALASALESDGYTGKEFYATSYTPASFATPTDEKALTGTYSYGLLPTKPAVKKYIAALHKYIPGYTGTIPSFNIDASWEGVDLMIKGLELAGRNPTRSAFITKLRHLTGYTIGGLSSPLSFNYLTGKLAPTLCANFVELKAKKFLAVPSTATTCGTLVSISG
jgi:branched-chain amino acid transport system substrate-binding protein